MAERPHRRSTPSLKAREIERDRSTDSRVLETPSTQRIRDSSVASDRTDLDTPSTLRSVKLNPPQRLQRIVFKRPSWVRSPGESVAPLTLDSVDDEVSVLPPPSAQAQRPMNKRRKPTQTKAQKANSQLPLRLSSPVVEIFDIAQVDCELGVQVLVNGKSLFARSHSAVDLILDDLVMAYQVEVEQGPFSGPLWDVKKPVYGPKFALHIGSKLVTRVNCNSQEDWVRFARRWWEVRGRPSVAITVKIPYLANAVPPLSVLGVVGANLDSTQARRQGPPSATQRQRQANADRVPLDQASGGDIPRQLIDRWKY